MTTKATQREGNSIFVADMIIKNWGIITVSQRPWRKTMQVSCIK